MVIYLFISSFSLPILPPFLICLKTTVAGFEPTPPEEKWFQVTRLRPLGHTVFVFILSFLFMYFNSTIYLSLQLLFPTISLGLFYALTTNSVHGIYLLALFPLKLIYLLFISLCFALFLLFFIHFSFIYLFIYLFFLFLFYLFPSPFLSFCHLICSSYTLKM